MNRQLSAETTRAGELTHPRPRSNQTKGKAPLRTVRHVLAKASLRQRMEPPLRWCPDGRNLKSRQAPLFSPLAPSRTDPLRCPLFSPSFFEPVKQIICSVWSFRPSPAQPTVAAIIIIMEIIFRYSIDLLKS